MSSPIHTRWRQAVVLAGVALLGGVAMPLGCRRTVGQGEVCGFGTGCAAGLACSQATGTCVLDTPIQPSCEPETTGCAGTLAAFRCVGGGVPEDPFETPCTQVPDAGNPINGVAFFCCVSIPHCDMLLEPCGDAGAVYSCADPVVPQAKDPSLACAKIFSLGGGSEYCCTREATCVPAVLFGCGDAGQSYACTGGANPAEYGLQCHPGYYADAGTVGTYCCEPQDAGSDAGVPE
jgi:hypothetical protein